MYLSSPVTIFSICCVFTFKYAPLAISVQLLIEWRLFEQTALHFASFYEHPDVCRLLCESGAPLDALDKKGRRPAMDTRNPTVRALIVAFERRRTLRTVLVTAAAGAAMCSVAFLLVRRAQAAPAAPAQRSGL